MKCDDWHPTQHNTTNLQLASLASRCSASLTLAHRVERIRRLMKLDDSKAFLMASELNHAQQIVTSLHKIFKSYVRGNAVHAQTKTGTYVALDGREVRSGFVVNCKVVEHPSFIQPSSFDSLRLPICYALRRSSSWIWMISSSGGPI